MVGEAAALASATVHDGHGSRRPPWKTPTMPLRVELKPFERIIIGESVIINSGTRTSFLIDGDTPILREKDTVTAETADTPAKRLYHCVQMMYLKNDVPRFRATYLDGVKQVRQAVPDSSDLIATVNHHVTEASLYKA